jgi:hypothetical protein
MNMHKLHTLVKTPTQNVTAKRHRLDVGLAVETFEQFVRAIDADRFAEAGKHRRRLESLGLFGITWQPGRAGGGT